MIRNQLKSAYRNFLRYKLHSFINLLGFVVCLISLIFIFLHIKEEVGYDIFHSKSDRTFRVTEDRYAPTFQSRVSSSGFMLAEALKDFPEIEYVTRIWNDFSRPMSVVCKDRKFVEQAVYFTDTSFFDVFDIEMIIGDGRKTLSGKDGLIITEEIARKYFGEADPIGKVFNIVSNESAGDYVVTGIAKSFPKKSHFHFDFLASTASVDMWWKKSYTTEVVSTYLVVKPETDAKSLEQKLQTIVQTKFASGIERFSKMSYKEYVEAGYWYKLALQPLEDIYLHSDFLFEMEPLGSISELRIIGLIGLILLLLAVINYVNLATASASLRMKEIGIRTVLGSGRGQLAIGFLLEALLLSTLGLISALICVSLLLPQFNDFTGHLLNLESVLSSSNIFTFLSISWALGLIAGLYPSFILSGISPLFALKGLTKEGGKGRLRNVLIIVQFSVSLFLIIATLVMSKQLDFIQNKKLGFDKSNLIAVERNMADINHLNRFKELIEGLTSVQSASITSHIGTHTQISTPFNPVRNAPETQFDLNIMKADRDYLKTMNVKLLEGRFFSEDFLTDSMSIVLNRKAAEALGMENPVGQQIYGWLKTPHTIIGIVDDFHFESLHSQIDHLGLLSTDLPWQVPFISYLLVKTAPEKDYQEVLADLKKEWDIAVPNRPFQFKFIDDHINRLYQKEQTTADIVQLFSLIAIFVAALGLFGMITFIVNGKLKEIGIRKVLGASLSHLYKFLTFDTVKPIFFSVIMTVPLSYYLLSDWLEKFAFHIEPGVQIFTMAILILYMLVILTISYTVIQASLKNPVDILREE